MRVSDDDLSQSTVTIEKELRRPGVDSVGVPKRKTVVDGDRPADALSAKVLRDIPALLLCGCFGGVNSDDFEAFGPVVRVETAQSRDHVATIEAVDRKDVEDDNLPRDVPLMCGRIQPIRGVEYGVEGRRGARRRGAGEQDGGE